MRPTTYNGKSRELAEIGPSANPPSQGLDGRDHSILFTGPNRIVFNGLATENKIIHADRLFSFSLLVLVDRRCVQYSYMSV